MSQWNCFRQDVRAYVGPETKRSDWLRLCVGILACSYKHPGFWAVMGYRLGCGLKSCPIPGLRHLLVLAYYMLVYPWVRFIVGVEIPLSCTIGPGFTIWHYGSIILGGGVIAGSNFSINSGVMIGRKDRNGDICRISDNVTIHAHSVVLCGFIGEGSIVGAASVVTKDVPPFCVVAGNPARVIKEMRPTTTLA